MSILHNIFLVVGGMVSALCLTIVIGLVVMTIADRIAPLRTNANRPTGWRADERTQRSYFN